jgi:uncharacterized protein YggE
MEKEKIISVNGIGTVYATPDIMSLDIEAESVKPTVDKAMSESSQAMNKMIETLKKDGVDEKDIQTVNFSISVDTRWDDKTKTDVFVGYRVSNEISVNIKFDEKSSKNLGKILDDVVSSGGNIVRLNNISFSVSDEEKYLESARKLAFGNAKKKASELAIYAGKKLGEALVISENDNKNYYARPQAKMLRSVGASSAPPIASGQVEMTVEVNVTFSLD